MAWILSYIPYLMQNIFHSTTKYFAELLFKWYSSLYLLTNRSLTKCPWHPPKSVKYQRISPDLREKFVSTTNVGTDSAVRLTAEWHAPVKYSAVGLFGGREFGGQKFRGRDVWLSGLFAVGTFSGLYIFLILVAWSTIFISKYVVNFASKHDKFRLKYFI